MTTLRQDVTYGLRSFARTPGFSVLAVLVIALGIGANASTFTMTYELLFRPVSAGGAALVSVHSRHRTIPDSYRLFSYPNYALLRARTDVFPSLAAYTLTMAAIGNDGDGTGRRALAGVVSANYFETLGVRLAAGRPFTIEEERPGARQPVAIVSHVRWERDGRDPALLGRTIVVNGASYAVVGVTPHDFRGTLAVVTPEVFLPLGVFEGIVGDRFKNDGRGLQHPGMESLSVFGRVSPDLGNALLTGRLDAMSGDLAAAFPVENADHLLSTHPMSRFSAGAQPQTNTALGTVSALLVTLSTLVLIVACLNLANMLLARGAVRRRELAVRLAIGAGRARVVRQLLTESLLLALAGSAVGLLLSHWMMSGLGTWLSSVLPFTLPIGAALNPAVTVATVGLAMLATVAFGLGPALRLSRRDLVSDLKARGTDTPPRRRVFQARNVLVVGQLALSLALLTAGGIFVRTALQSANTRPGFDYDALLLASVDTRLAGMDDGSGRETYERVLERVRATPGVAAATLASTVPFGDAINSARFARVGDGATATARAFRAIGADYFRTLGAPLLRGREFTLAEERSPDAPAVAIVDAAFARQLFGDQDPIGRAIRLAPSAEAAAVPGSVLEIVGLAPPIMEELLDRAPVPHVYVPFGRHFQAAMHLHARLAPGVDERAGLAAMRREIRDVDRRLPIMALSSFAAFHAHSLELAALRGAAAVFMGLGALALILAVAGVYSLRSYLVAQRTREFGIRMALGAGTRNVLTHVLGDGIRLTATGLVVGVPLALAVSVSLGSVFVDVGGIDLPVIAAAVAILGGSALAASLVPARRAASTAPSAALRME